MPRSHSWFIGKITPIFQNQVVGKALDCLQLDTIFTTNCLAVMHKFKRKNNTGKFGLEVISVLKTLHQWHSEGNRRSV